MHRPKSCLLRFIGFLGTEAPFRPDDQQNPSRITIRLIYLLQRQPFLLPAKKLQRICPGLSHKLPELTKRQNFWHKSTAALFRRAEGNSLPTLSTGFNLSII